MSLGCLGKVMYRIGRLLRQLQASSISKLEKREGTVRRGHVQEAIRYQTEQSTG